MRTAETKVCGGKATGQSFIFASRREGVSCEEVAQCEFLYSDGVKFNALENLMFLS
jgi:hypothetical protein